jgi:hypothetical protein
MIYSLNKYIQSKKVLVLYLNYLGKQMLYVKGEHDEYVRDGAVGFDLKANFTNGVNNFDCFKQCSSNNGFCQCYSFKCNKGTQ